MGAVLAARATTHSIGIRTKRRLRRRPSRELDGGVRSSGAQALVYGEPWEGRMPSPLEVHDWHELDVYAQDGEHVGKLADVYVSKETGEPEFLLVSSGFLGHKLHMVPADGASRADDKVQVAFDKGTIESAPSVAADDDIDPAEEKRLFEHYGRSYTPHPEGILILRRFVLVERR